MRSPKLCLLTSVRIQELTQNNESKVDRLFLCRNYRNLTNIDTDVFFCNAHSVARLGNRIAQLVEIFRLRTENDELVFARRPLSETI